MKNATAYGKEVKRLFAALKRDHGKPTLEPVEDPMEQVLRGVLAQHASLDKAEAALGRLFASMVDLNELRVTSIAEIVETIGVDFPRSRPAAEAISRILSSLFSRKHSLSLAFIKPLGRRAAEAFLDELDGMSPCVRASVILRCLNAHAIPVDAQMLTYLRENGCIAPESDVNEVQGFLERQLRSGEAGMFYALVKQEADSLESKRKAKRRAGDGPAKKPAEPAKPKEKPAAQTTVRKKKATATSTSAKKTATGAEKKSKTPLAKHK